MSVCLIALELSEKISDWLIQIISFWKSHKHFFIWISIGYLSLAVCLRGSGTFWNQIWLANSNYLFLEAIELIFSDILLVVWREENSRNTFVLIWLDDELQLYYDQHSLEFCVGWMIKLKEFFLSLSITWLFFFVVFDNWGLKSILWKKIE